MKNESAGFTLVSPVSHKENLQVYQVRVTNIDIVSWDGNLHASKSKFLEAISMFYNYMTP